MYYRCFKLPFNLTHSIRCFSTNYSQALDLLSKIHYAESKISPEIKKVTKVDMPNFNERTENISEALTFKHSPNKFMRYMDTSMEKFFYQREYTQKNFNFYLQVLCSQYKTEEIEKAFRNMKTLGIEPDLESYTHLITAFAKLGDIDKVEQIFDEGRVTFSKIFGFILNYS